MKKFIAVIVVLFVAFTVKAQEKDYIIVKKENNITVFQIQENQYSDRNLIIDATQLTDPTVSALKGLEVPEKAWGMLSSYQNAVYDTRLEKALSEKKEIQGDYDTAVEVNAEMKESIFWSKFLAGTFILFSIILIIVIKNKEKEIKKIKIRG